MGDVLSPSETLPLQLNTAEPVAADQRQLAEAAAAVSMRGVAVFRHGLSVAQHPPASCCERQLCCCPRRKLPRCCCFLGGSSRGAGPRSTRLS
jgi:hypothetical protein